MKLTGQYWVRPEVYAIIRVNANNLNTPFHSECQTGHSGHNNASLCVCRHEHPQLFVFFFWFCILHFLFYVPFLDPIAELETDHRTVLMVVVDLFQGFLELGHIYQDELAALVPNYDVFGALWMHIDTGDRVRDILLPRVMEHPPLLLFLFRVRIQVAVAMADNYEVVGDGYGCRACRLGERFGA